MADAIWSCKIGETDRVLLPDGCDSPMRDAVHDAFKQITGHAPHFILSGWGAELTEPERAAVENREPSEEYRREWERTHQSPPAVPVQDALTTPKDGKHFIPLTGKPPCPTCGQPEGIQLTVGATGFSCGTGFEHKPECAANFCPHGVRWTSDCPLCDAEYYDEEGEDEVNDNRR